MKKATLQIITAILILGLFCGAAGAAPVIVSVSPSNSTTVDETVGGTKIFSVQTNEPATINWSVNGITPDSSLITYDNGTNTSTFSHKILSGSYEVKATLQPDGGNSTWTVNGTLEIPVITLSDPPSSNVSNGAGESRTFKAAVSQTSNMTWSLDGATLYTNTSVLNSSYTHISVREGTHTVKVEAENANGTAEPKYWTWTVGTTSASVSVDPSEGTVNIPQGGTKTFYVNSTNNQNIKVEWRVNGEMKGSQEGAYSSYQLNGTTAGKYTLSAVVTDPSGIFTSSTKTWTVDVQDKYYSRGNRIWEEGMSTTYTWDAQSFSGFYYDLDSGVSSEEMTITNIKRNIKTGDIEYSTRPTETKFEHKDWGSYQIIGFRAEKYFAGYNDKTKVEGVGKVSLISDGILTKILTDSDDKKSAYTGDSFELEEGYSLNIVEVDINGKSVWVQLEKDGKVVNDDFVSSNQNYVYKTDIGGAENVPIIIVHFGTVFAGKETTAVFIQGIFQVSETYLKLENGDTYGKMEVKSLSSSEIKMKNEGNIDLERGKTIDLMGKMKIQVADDAKLRFAPVLDTSEAGTYELRGTVYDSSSDSSSLPAWTPYNFEGFYYNIDEGIGTEKLEITDLKDRRIPDGALVYTSSPQAVDFEHRAWGNFTVVGFMAKKYFAGYLDDTVNGEIDDVSLLSDKVLSEVLIDSDDKESMYSGSSLVLEEGYSLQIKEVDVNGKSVWVQLEKDGKVVADDFVASGKNYIYKGSVGKAEDVPIIIVRFGTVFVGQETSVVPTEGIFQISDKYIEINNGDTFDKMKVTSVSESGITMKNDGSIGLGKDETLDVMRGIKFKTADNDILRFYPFVEVETGSDASRELNINLPGEIIVNETFNIGVTAGNNPIEGVNVKVNATSAGKTNADGIVQYTAEKVGTFKISAEKDGYTTASKDMKVIPPKEKMSLNVTPETVYVGDTITIEALKTIGGTPIEGVNVSINGDNIGKTDSEGKIKYRTEEVGKIKVSAKGEGFLDKDVEVNVKDYEAIFEFSNLVIKPIKVKAGKEATITVDAENNGNAAGDYNVELFVNESSVDSQKISLNVGENTTVTFKHAEETPGTYIVKVGGQEATYTVKEKSSILLYTLLGIILLLAGGIAYMFTKGGWTVDTLQEKIDELIK
ncbi:MAG: S-layer protein domain-containing protein [Euryarchaeota archaeon]|nr:S-layer protein domain-containing protein [Euryarchaeota archaeon]